MRSTTLDLNPVELDCKWHGHDWDTMYGRFTYRDENDNLMVVKSDAEIFKYDYTVTDLRICTRCERLQWWQLGLWFDYTEGVT